MTPQQFTDLWIELSETVADEFYPKNECSVYGQICPDRICTHGKTEQSRRRGDYLRDQAVLHSKIVAALTALGVLKPQG